MGGHLSYPWLGRRRVSEIGQTHTAVVKFKIRSVAGTVTVIFSGDLCGEWGERGVSGRESDISVSRRDHVTTQLCGQKQNTPLEAILCPSYSYPFLFCEQETETATPEDAVGDGRLRTRFRHLAKWTKHTRCLWFGPFVSSCENMASSIKPQKYMT